MLLFLNRESYFSKILTENPYCFTNIVFVHFPFSIHSTIATFNIPLTRLRNCMFI